MTTLMLLSLLVTPGGMDRLEADNLMRSRSVADWVDHPPPKPEPQPEPEPEPEPEPQPKSEPLPPAARNIWDNLADCESGNWVDGGKSFQEGSARWSWAKPGTEVPPWGTTVHHGGLQFAPSTWSWLAPEGYPAFAYDATREQQIAVAEKVLAAQGWGAWPVCASKLGLR
jgi:resuscitation-promoting factor RpfB